MAAFVPYYAVHYADAEHALEKVTKGYRLVLVLSVCLPLEMRHLMRNPDQSLSDQLGGLISRMGQDDDSFALLLAHEYTERSIGGLGPRGLKGVDRARFRALHDVNASVVDNKKLGLALVHLTHDISYNDDGGYWDESERGQTIVWFAMSGEGVGNTRATGVTLNFLNPGQETNADFWDGRGNSTFEGYLGNAGPTRDTTYSRYAVMAWPVARSAETPFDLPSRLRRPVKRPVASSGASGKKRARMG